jgi:hypothetical protein
MLRTGFKKTGIAGSLATYEQMPNEGDSGYSARHGCDDTNA